MFTCSVGKQSYDLTISYQAAVKVPQGGWMDMYAVACKANLKKGNEKDMNHLGIDVRKRKYVEQ